MSAPPLPQGSALLQQFNSIAGAHSDADLDKRVWDIAMYKNKSGIFKKKFYYNKIIKSSFCLLPPDV